MFPPDEQDVTLLTWLEGHRKEECRFATWLPGQKSQASYDSSEPI
jgi:hypothetical protein